MQWPKNISIEKYRILPEEEKTRGKIDMIENKCYTNKKKEITIRGYRKRF